MISFCYVVVFYLSILFAANKGKQVKEVGGSRAERKINGIKEGDDEGEVDDRGKGDKMSEMINMVVV